MSHGLTDKTGKPVSVILDKDSGSYVIITDASGEQAGNAYFVDNLSDPENPARIFHHTVVDERFGGRGLGTALVKGALDDSRERGFTIVPVCSMVKHWLEKNGEDFAAAGGSVREPGQSDSEALRAAEGSQDS